MSKATGVYNDTTPEYVFIVVGQLQWLIAMVEEPSPSAGIVLVKKRYGTPIVARLRNVLA